MPPKDKVGFIKDLASTITMDRPIKQEEDPENIPGLTWTNPPASSIYNDPFPRTQGPIPPSVLSVNPSTNPKTLLVQDKKDQQKHWTVHADKVNINTPAFTINVTKCSAKHSPSPPHPPSLPQGTLLLSHLHLRKMNIIHRWKPSLSFALYHAQSP